MHVLCDCRSEIVDVFDSEYNACITACYFCVLSVSVMLLLVCLFSRYEIPYSISYFSVGFAPNISLAMCCRNSWN